MATRWQKLGAFVANVGNLSIEQLNGFKSVGGSWVVPVIYEDDINAGPNLARLDDLKGWCQARGIEVGGWFNCFGGSYAKQDKYVNDIANMVNNLDLKITILDLEAAYQYPEGDANLMPYILGKLRDRLPNKDIGVSTNGMNSSMIYNGRTLVPPRSFYDLGIRCLPQWYSWAWEEKGAQTPTQAMKWLKDEGHKDFNFRDGNAVKTSYRGLPLSYVHGTAEVTGLENASLKKAFDQMVVAKNFGYTPGSSIYLLENTPESDWQVCKAYMNTLWLV